MKKIRIRLAVMVTLTALVASAQPGNKPDKKIEVQLLWGTDLPTSPNPAHKPVAADIQQRLKNSPLKWTNYFMVKKLTLTVPRGQATNAAISDKCYRRGSRTLSKDSCLNCHSSAKTNPWKNARKHLPRGDVFIYSGNAPGTKCLAAGLKETGVRQPIGLARDSNESQGA